MFSLEEKSEGQQSQIHPLGTMNASKSQNFMAIRPIVIRVFESGPKWSTKRLTDIAIHRAMPPAWLKKIADSFCKTAGVQTVTHTQKLLNNCDYI